ncbi:Uroporphyrinogen-III synthase [Ophiocordyceps camponoti-floridani]|uniref:Uroporphyrinogen-III synthase n=1 Tax=Ophiocordyceps camponoti-floridani TaxID=2030778 RepID=A0A8H4VE42_9HYPO|nr:Uroporphyrinogen-III synthase [Ophiocordyceps camponoti-floridani]
MSPPRPDSSAPTNVPIILLKTPSSPRDPYQELLVSSGYAPQFVPVLCHRPSAEAAARLEALLRGRNIGTGPGCAFGGLILTSQRAVEALAAVVEAGREDGGADWPHLRDVPVYAVGPATARALRELAPMRVMGGEECGNGEALARFILDNYHRLDGLDADHRPPLLFLVGEQRRDVIPRTLMDSSLPSSEQINVTEEVVYITTVMPSLARALDDALRRTADAPVRWVVVFSPSGCDSLLRSLGWLDQASSDRSRHENTCIATIGPTTRAHLVDTFGFEPHVCAATPSPEGVRQAVEDYMRQQARPR